MVKQVLLDIAHELDQVLEDPAPEAYFTSFGDSALSMTLFFWVAEYSQLFRVTDQVNTLIIKRFREKGIEIPFPIRTVIMEKD